MGMLRVTVQIVNNPPFLTTVILSRHYLGRERWFV